MDTTLGQTIERVKRDASLASRGPVFTLASTHTANDTTIVANEEPKHLGIGSVVSMGTSSYYVTAVNVPTKTITVIPSYHGTTDETYAPPQILTVDDIYPGGALKDNAEKEIRSWGNKLWRVVSVDIAANGSDLAYEVPGSLDPFDVLDARRAPSTDGWYGFRWNDDRWPRVRARLIFDASVATFPSGLAIQFQTLAPEGIVRVALACPFDLSPFTRTTDLVSDVGLEPEWIEVLEAGMRARSLNGSIASRADWRSGGHERMAEEASLLDVVRAAQAANDERMRALHDHANMLRGRWPYRSI